MNKNMTSWSPPVVLLLILAVGLIAEEKSSSFEGTLVCSKCYLTDNSLTTNYHFPMKPCGTLCLQNSSPAGLVTKDKQFYVIVAPSKTLAEHVGRQTQVSGSLYGNALLATTVQVEKSGHWEKVDLQNMMQ